MLVNSVLFAVALLFGVPAATLAHDPGLSVLDVRVERGRLAADLMLAGADADAARRLEQSPNGDLGAFALQAVELRIAGRQLHGTVAEIAIDSSQGFRIRIEFGRASGTQLTVRSAVPRQLANGHRELLSVRSEDGSLLAERMLDAHANEAAADLKIDSDANPLFLAALLLAVLAGGSWLGFLHSRRPGFQPPPRRRSASTAPLPSVLKM